MKPWEKYSQPAVQPQVQLKPWEKYKADTTTTVLEPSIEQPQPEPQKGYLKRSAEFYTQDIPEMVKGISGRISERESRIFEPTELGEAAVAKTGATGIGAQVVRDVAGTPERAVRVAGGIIGDIGDFAGALVTIGLKSADVLTGGLVDKKIEQFGGMVAESDPVKNLMKWWGGLSKAEKANYSTAVDLTEAFGFKAGKVLPEVIEGAGKKAIRTGTDILGGELKIKASLAKRGYGKRIDIKKQNIVDNISKYNLEDPTGNFSKMADNANNLATQKVREADRLLTDIAQAPDSPKGQIVDDIIQDAYENASDFADLGDQKTVTRTLDNILDEAYGEGLATTVEKGVDELITFKRRLNKRGKLFVEGPAEADADNLKRAIKKRLYLDAVTKIEDFSPDAARLNREAKELWDIEAVASDATARIASKDQFLSFSDKLIGGTAGLGAVSAMANQNPGLALKTILGGLALSAASRGAGQGRGAAAIIKTGKGIKKAGEGIRKTAGKTLPAAGLGTSNLLFRGLPQDED